MRSAGRIFAMVLRYVYLLRRSWPRILELIYWPAVQLILWGFISKFFVEHSSWLAQASGVLMAAVLLWDVLFRAHLGVSLAFFEEMYSRNLGHLFVSPLRVTELVGALLAISFLRTLIGISGAALLAIPLYNFSIFGLGLPLLGMTGFRAERYDLLFLLYPLAILVASLATVWLGVQARRSGLINIGMGAAAAVVLIQYFSWSFRLLDRALAFVLGGVLLIALALWIERKRRHLIEGLEP